MEKIRDYGTNNPGAYKTECYSFLGKSIPHKWKEKGYIGRCFFLEECENCKAIHRVDSSD